MWLKHHSSFCFHSTGKVITTAADKSTDKNTRYVWTHEEIPFLEIVQVFAVFPASIVLFVMMFSLSLPSLLCLFSSCSSLCTFFFCSHARLEILRHLLSWFTPYIHLTLADDFAYFSENLVKICDCLIVAWFTKNHQSLISHVIIFQATNITASLIDSNWSHC